MPAEHHEDGPFHRGIRNAVLLSIPLWALIVVAGWLLWRWLR